jgi:hypothetical protein
MPKRPSALPMHDPPRAQHLVMMEFGDRAQLDDPKQARASGGSHSDPATS